ncbi:RNA-binding protein 48 isoform X2 [Phalaenopsis equestris]|uniref:RNA-binding protein 48 isoform X2 n=1 Tax=Phalaenopsis equestris TaxID=78828 RepID=UPI0009E5AC35|nr:RNA-binding protein 48 isoform X2 [Phalaenopsis equestris]
MPRNRDDPPAIRVYTICDESKYLIVRNVPALGCGEELSKLFGSYGEIVDCKPMDAEDCEPFTDVYWIEFSQVSNARFAKRKLDESIFLGNRLQISYAPDFESLSDTRDKLERRRIEVLSRIKFPRPDGSKSHITTRSEDEKHYREHPNQVSSNQDYFPSASMNETVRLVRSKLDKVQSSSEHIANPPALKKIRMDNRRRI